MTYNISKLEYQTNCSSVSQVEWNELMKGAKRADKKKINDLVKKFLPELYLGLSLNLSNPYKYFKTKNHFVLVHSATEYFLKIN